jgi:hypothetical protein
MRLANTARRSPPNIIWRWVPEGPRYITTKTYDAQGRLIRESIRLDVPEGAYLGMTEDGKFMVGEVFRDPTAP